MELDWGDIQPRPRRNVNLWACIERRHKSRDLYGVEMGPGLSWDAHLETWIVWYWTRKGWDTLAQLGEHLDGGETRLLKPEWVWDNALVELRCNLVDLFGAEMLPGCRRDANIRTWIEMRFNSDKEKNVNLVNLGARNERRHKSRDLFGVEMGPGLSWDAHLETWIAWYVIGMDLRYNSPFGKGPGWGWDSHLSTWMCLSWCLERTNMQYGRPGSKWDVAGCRRDANIRTWMEVRFKSDKERRWIYWI